jgi:cytoskeletal protein CcmA (bactofilin family)
MLDMLKMVGRDDKDAGAPKPTTSFETVASVNSPTHAKGVTVIGEHLSIEGTIRADEDVLIEGAIKGTIEIKAHQLTVGAKGKVEADVVADSVVVSGRMVGNITAKNKVQITKTADFTGQIKAKRIAVDDGAFIKASIELDRDDKHQQSASGKPVDAIMVSSNELSKQTRPEPARMGAK